MTDEEKKYGLLNRVVLGNIHMWLDQHSKEKEADMPDICYKLKSAGYASRVINGFSDEERDFMHSLTKDEEFMEIANKHISLVVMALEVMKYHIEHTEPHQRAPKLNINERKLRMGKAVYAIHMLKTKQVNKKLYDKQKEVIDDTEKHSKVWYDNMKKHIFNHNFKGC